MTLPTPPSDLGLGSWFLRSATDNPSCDGTVSYVAPGYYYFLPWVMVLSIMILGCSAQRMAVWNRFHFHVEFVWFAASTFILKNVILRKLYFENIMVLACLIAMDLEESIKRFYYREKEEE